MHPKKLLLSIYPHAKSPRGLEISAMGVIFRELSHRPVHKFWNPPKSRFCTFCCFSEGKSLQKCVPQPPTDVRFVLQKCVPQPPTDVQISFKMCAAAADRRTNSNFSKIRKTYFFFKNLKNPIFFKNFKKSKFQILSKRLTYVCTYVWCLFGTVCMPYVWTYVWRPICIMCTCV